MSTAVLQAMVGIVVAATAMIYTTANLNEPLFCMTVRVTHHSMRQGGGAWMGS